jgi:hypothetical protein
MAKRIIVKEPETQQPFIGRHDLIIVAGCVVTVLVLAVLVLFAFSVFSLETQDSGQPLPETGTPSVGEIGSIGGLQIGPRTTTAGPAAPVVQPADFSLGIGEMTSCGLTCRQLTATITNTGGVPVHNVCITLRMVNSAGEVIRLNGDETLRHCIGDLGAGRMREETVTIDADCGMLALGCLRQTLTLETHVVSDEKDVRFPDKLITV